MTPEDLYKQIDKNTKEIIRLTVETNSLKRDYIDKVLPFSYGDIVLVNVNIDEFIKAIFERAILQDNGQIVCQCRKINVDGTPSMNRYPMNFHYNPKSKHSYQIKPIQEKK